MPRSFPLLVLSVLLFTTATLYAQRVNPELLKNRWKAVWIAMPGESGKEYGVYHFRKSFELQETPKAFVINVSADNRYKLFVNDHLVSLGPARGDVYHWNFETVDIASYLHRGKNVMAALVWNEGEYRPEAQISHRTGFILQGNTTQEEIINSDNSWKIFKSVSYKPLTGVGYPTYYVAGPGEFVDMMMTPVDWTNIDFDDSSWKNASAASWGAQGAPKGSVDAFGWMLVPSTLPQMEMTSQRMKAVRQSEGVKLPPGFPETKSDIVIPKNTTARLLLDQSVLTNAYLNLEFSGSKGSSIALKYAEALFESADPIRKGNRNEIEGKTLLGRKDSIVSNGNAYQKFETLSWRTFRYIQLTVYTHDEPLTIHDIYGVFTGFPFQRKATLQANEDAKNILDVGWRTARLCAVETYMDCPYYEQLQYVGDTRIQALVSYYNSGDDRLARNALNLMDYSRISEGVTLSRHPSYSPQIIPTFSLWYIGMLHDYWMYRPDSLFVKEKLYGVREILNFFTKYQAEDGSLRNTPYWLFTDWVNGKKTWSYGVAPKGSDGTSSVLDLQLLWAFQLAAEMERHMGMKEFYDLYSAKAKQLTTTIRERYWDSQRGLLADTPEKDIFSQHANSLAILTGIVSETEKKSVAEKLLTSTNLTPASIYFRFYLHQALIKSGFGDDYMKWLDKWRENISMGMTTWAEISEISETRSDCHAWGASPNIEFFRTVLGVDSDAPGFTVVKIEPHLGALTSLSGQVPHPNGRIELEYKFVKKKWNVSIVMPPNTRGYLQWHDKRTELRSGQNNFAF